MLHHPLAFGHGKLAQQEVALTRLGRHPVGIAATGVQKRGLCRPRRAFCQFDQLVLDLEGTQRLKFAQCQDVCHDSLLVNTVWRSSPCTFRYFSQVSSMTMTIPQIVSSVLPTAYVTV